MAEEDAQLSDTESKIKSAMFSRASYFRDQADSLTFEGVRRLLEKDLGLETHALDAHKRFVKHWLQPCIESADSDKVPKNEDDAIENVVSSTQGNGEPVDGVQMKKESEEPNSASGDKMEDSPVMGLMTGPKNVKKNTAESKSKVPTESTIKKAIWARASYLKENSQNVTLAGVRRLLEEDLELEKHTLDPFKKFINKQVDEVMESPDVPQTTANPKKKNLKKGTSEKAPSVSSKEEAPPSSESEGDDEVEEDEVKPRKKSTPKGKPQKAEAVRKRKRAEEGTKGARKKQSKVSKSTSEGSSEEKGGDVSGDENSDASAERPAKKKEAPKAVYGKKVEHLKSVIKSCGMSVPPSIYKKVKQAPEEKREASLIKELEEILAKEGLSANPSEKEIKDVKKRKERARELEGIDLSNIVSSSRRRSTSSFVPPPKPKIPDISESESEESENEEEDEEEDEEVEVEEGEEGEEEQENGDNNSQSEESEQGNDDSE